MQKWEKLEQLLKIRRSSAPRPIECEAYKGKMVRILSDAIDLNQVYNHWITTGREILVFGIYEGGILKRISIGHL
jgi:hypothetical protein